MNKSFFSWVAIGPLASYKKASVFLPNCQPVTFFLTVTLRFIVLVCSCPPCSCPKLTSILWRFPTTFVCGQESGAVPDC